MLLGGAAFDIGENMAKNNSSNKQPKVEFKEMLEGASKTQQTKYQRFNSGDYALSDKTIDRANKCLDNFENYHDIALVDRLRPWEKTFPDDFYKHLFRLKQKPYNPYSSKRPAYVGNWTLEIVYDRLAPLIVRELKDRTPKGRNGRHSKKLFQSLSPLGYEALQRHLAQVIILMKLSKDWSQFYQLLNEQLPKYPQNGQEVLQYAIQFGVA